jgi:hypothetical protein
LPQRTMRKREKKEKRFLKNKEVRGAGFLM